MRKLAAAGCMMLLTFAAQQLTAHCQMPCGIYHDQMIYDKIDEYYETMYKAISVLDDNKFDTIQQKNQFIRWVMTKERMSDETAHIILEYFLQQKLKPDDPDSLDLVKSAHRMLFLLVSIKQTVDLNIVKEFGKEWENFKSLFHPELICRPPTPAELKKLSEGKSLDNGNKGKPAPLEVEKEHKH
jgi:nickel superoxide dismutase